MAKSFIEELTGYRVKVKKDGKEIMNVPGFLALPAALIAPKIGIAGMIAAPLLGCSVHLENEEGKTVDVGQAVKDAANTVADTAKTAVKTVKEELDKAWESISADDPEECPPGEENAEDKPEHQDEQDPQNHPDNQDKPE